MNYVTANIFKYTVTSNKWVNIIKNISSSNFPSTISFKKPQSINFTLNLTTIINYQIQCKLTAVGMVLPSVMGKTFHRKRFILI